MSPVFPQHPLRQTLKDELHARAYEPLRGPARVSHLAYLSGERGSGRNDQHLRRLLGHYRLPLPERIEQAHTACLGPIRMRWERHTEFITYSFSLSEPFLHPFKEAVLDELPQDWLRDLPGEVVSAVSLALETREMPERDQDGLSALFEGNPVIGSEVAGGAGLVWSDLRLNPDGFVHILVRNLALSEAQAGRLVKRVLDVSTYRAMALLGFPIAREVGRSLSDADRQLADLAARMTDSQLDRRASAERELLACLTALAAEIEEVTARTDHRFEASRAYYRMIQQRHDQLRQGRIEGMQSFGEFMDARLAPAIATCESTAARQRALADRAARLTALLRARVEVQLQEQNRCLLESMDRRARFQLRLQETVEGLSIIAIGYYGVGLVGYVLKGLETGGWIPDATLGIALAVPLVVGTAWFGLHRLRRSLRDDGGSSKPCN